MTEIRVKIDNVTYTAPEGVTILEIARANGVEVPTLCYHPKLSIVGACRMCVVEVAGSRGLMTACSTVAVDGMEVNTRTDAVVKSRRNVLELLLSDHPMECLTCEAAGKCSLQKYAYEYSVTGATYQAEPRDHDLDSSNPFYLRDMRMCITCGQCVRVCDEIVGASALGFSERGDRTFVGPAFGHNITDTTCVSCGSCVDFCPTTALTSTHGRNRLRTANIRKVTTTCGYCGVGCQINLLVDRNEILGVEPVEGPANDGFLCVKGKYGFNFVNHPDRLKTPLVRRNGQLVEASWDEALELVARKFSSIIDQHGRQSIMSLSSARCTNEENYLMQKLFRAVIGNNNIDHCARL